METLKFEEICPYLPYSLIIQYKIEGLFGNVKLYEGELIDLNWRSKEANSSCMASHKLEDIKPLLIPMSEINTIMKWPDGEYMMTDIPNEHETADGMQYDTFIMYVERHFDVFRLIERGLALNKLTFKS